MRAHIFFFSCFCFLFWWQNIFINHVPSVQYWNLLRFYKKKRPKEIKVHHRANMHINPDFFRAYFVHPK